MALEDHTRARAQARKTRQFTPLIAVLRELE